MILFSQWEIQDDMVAYSKGAVVYSKGTRMCTGEYPYTSWFSFWHMVALYSFTLSYIKYDYGACSGYWNVSENILLS